MTLDEPPPANAEVSYVWTVDGAATEHVGATVPASATTRGESWRVVVTFTVPEERSWSASATTVIVNTPPTITSASVSPDDVIRGETLSCAWGGWVDLDGDEADVLYAWFRVEDGELYRLDEATATLDSYALWPSDEVLCEVTPLDDFELGEPVTSATSVVLNQAPVLTGVAIMPDAPTEGSVVHCGHEIAADPDGELVSLGWSWEVNGAVVPEATGATLSDIPRDVPIRCTIAVTDPWGERVEATSEPVTATGPAPELGSVSLEGLSYCRPWRCVVGEVTEGAQVFYRWEINGAPIDADEPELPEGMVAEGDTVRCFAQAVQGDTSSPELASEGIVAGDPSLSIGGARIRDHGRPGDLVHCVLVDVEGGCAAEQGVEYVWTVNNQIIRGLSGPTFDSTGLETGDAIRCNIITAAQAPIILSNELRLSAKGWEIVGEIANGNAGYAVTVADDLDGDQFAEIVVGAPNLGLNQAPQAGRVYLIGGRDDIEHLELRDVTAGNTSGRTLESGSGGYDLARLACGPHTFTDGCPHNTNIGETDGWIRGPRGAGLGFSVAYPGDIDNDGIGDLVVSAPYQIVTRLWQGRTYVLSGVRALTEAGVLGEAAIGEAGYVFDGECGRRLDVDRDLGSLASRNGGNGDLSGYQVAALGDVNGDGLGDFAVGAINNGEDDEGAVYVVYGRAPGEDGETEGVTATDLIIRGCEPGSEAGYGPLSGKAGFGILGFVSNGGVADVNWGRFISPAGDFDGDGYDDVLLHSSLGSRYSYLVRGGPNVQGFALEDAAELPEVVTEIAHGEFRYIGDGMGGGSFFGRLLGGQPAGGGGDVNGDGYDDIAFMAIDFDNYAFLHVIYGGPPGGPAISLDNSANGTRGFFVRGATDSDSFVGELAIVGDVNGDGYDDIALGVPPDYGDGGGNGDGRVIVVFGAAEAPDISISDLAAGIGGFIIEARHRGEGLGWSVDGGDIDGDGLDDIVAGAPFAPNGEDSRAGRVVVEYGRDFGGTISQFGGRGPDHLVGTSAAESLIGGQGDDRIQGGGGADVLYGGAGDDLIEVGDLSFKRVRGGAGDDTLTLTAAAGDLNLVTGGGLIEDIERIGLDGQTLTISKVRILRLSDTSNRLIVDGAAGRVVTLAGDAWRNGELVSRRGRTYATFTDGFAELWIDTRLDTTIPPTVFGGTLEIDENPAQGEVIGDFLAIDPDGDNAALRWRVVETSDAGAFSLDPQTGAVRVEAAAMLDYEAGQRTARFLVEVTDEDGLSQRAEFIITLRDVNEPPRFATTNIVWSVEEGGGPDEVIGSLAARDQDAGDTLTFTILEGDEALFDLDPETGALTVQEGTALDYETSTSHTLTMTVTDEAGLADTATVTVNVLDRDTIERNVRVNFALRRWSNLNNEPYSTTGLNLSAVAEGTEDINFCRNIQGDFSESQSLYAGSLLGTLSFDVDYASDGTICVGGTIAFDTGQYNADIPVDLELGFPDEVSPGDRITITSDARIADGAAFWGSTPNQEASVYMSFEEVDLYMRLCANGDCNILMDRQNLTGNKRDLFGIEAANWSAPVTVSDDRRTLTAATTEPVVPDVTDWRLSGEDGSVFLYMFALMEALGLPSNTGELLLNLSDNPITHAFVEYVVFDLSFIWLFESTWDYRFQLNGFDALVTFEDGSTATFEVGTPAQVDVPTGSDINNDGKVGLTIDVSPRVNYHADHYRADTMGYTYSGGAFRLNLINENRQRIAPQVQIGPYLTETCLPYANLGVGGGIKPCASIGADYDFDHSPSGFEAPLLRGAIDLAQ